ncbi:TY-Chap domain-containing protein [Actinomadura rayongensis]|uniref:Uncharacterized protein n=1 Tax=Actinomadura rayongensis TaxID=1429076 RepID=A0A6I4WFF0_9ACTN|nr:SseB family protein [Actinomadura rayongensis]MXQ66576.1 hypothetical protein [Actinomadura rayongensis]
MDWEDFAGRLSRELQRLPVRSFIIVQGPTGLPYVQAMRSTSAIDAEAVGSAFLPRPLSHRQERRLGALGWRKPDGRDRLNWSHRLTMPPRMRLTPMQSAEVDRLADRMVAAFRDVYGVRSPLDLVYQAGRTSGEGGGLALPGLGLPLAIPEAEQTTAEAAGLAPPPAAGDLEAELTAARRRGDEQAYLALLAGATLCLPVPGEPGSEAADQFATAKFGDGTYVLGFTSPEAMDRSLRGQAVHHRPVTLTELAGAWPRLEWGLAVDPGLPSAAYLDAETVAKTAGTDLAARPAAAAPVPESPSVRTTPLPSVEPPAKPEPDDKRVAGKPSRPSAAAPQPVPSDPARTVPSDPARTVPDTPPHRPALERPAPPSAPERTAPPSAPERPAPQALPSTPEPPRRPATPDVPPRRPAAPEPELPRRAASPQPEPPVRTAQATPAPVQPAAPPEPDTLSRRPAAVPPAPDAPRTPAEPSAPDVPARRPTAPPRPVAPDLPARQPAAVQEPGRQAAPPEPPRQPAAAPEPGRQAAPPETPRRSATDVPARQPAGAPEPARQAVPAPPDVPARQPAAQQETEAPRRPSTPEIPARQPAAPDVPARKPAAQQEAEGPRRPSAPEVPARQPAAPREFGYQAAPPAAPDVPARKPATQQEAEPPRRSNVPEAPARQPVAAQEFGHQGAPAEAPGRADGAEPGRRTLPDVPRWAAEPASFGQGASSGAPAERHAAAAHALPQAPGGTRVGDRRVAPVPGSTTPDPPGGGREARTPTEKRTPAETRVDAAKPSATLRDPLPVNGQATKPLPTVERAAPTRIRPTSAEFVVMQKVLRPEHVRHYVEGGYDLVAGYVHRLKDVADLRTPAGIVRALGLTYQGTPFSASDDTIHVLRWPAVKPTLFRTPLGGIDEWSMEIIPGGWVIENAPFPGSGYAPGDGPPIPEFKIDSQRLPHEAEIYRIDRSGEATPIARFDADRRQWRRAPAGDAEGARR